MKKTSWYDYYPGTYEQLNTKNYYTSQIDRPCEDYTYKGNSYISDCLFLNITSDTYGAAIYIYDSCTRFMVESSSIISCKTFSQYCGGIFYDYVDSGQCVQKRICMYDCSIDNNDEYYTLGPACRIWVKNAHKSKNIFEDSSVISCIKNNDATYCTVVLVHGQISVRCGNFSNNFMKSTSALVIEDTVHRYNYSPCISYCSFVKNRASGEEIINFNFNDNQTYHMTKCNLIKNNGKKYVIECNVNVIITDCCILENNAENAVFFSKRKLIFINCSVDNKDSVLGDVSFNNIQKDPYVHSLKMFGTNKCIAEYDFYQLNKFSITIRKDASLSGIRIYVLYDSKYTLINNGCIYTNYEYNNRFSVDIYASIGQSSNKTYVTTFYSELDGISKEVTKSMLPEGFKTDYSLVIKKGTSMSDIRVFVKCGSSFTEIFENIPYNRTDKDTHFSVDVYISTLYCPNCVKINTVDAVIGGFTKTIERSDIPNECKPKYETVFKNYTFMSCVYFAGAIILIVCIIVMKRRNNNIIPAELELSSFN